MGPRGINRRAGFVLTKEALAERPAPERPASLVDRIFLALAEAVHMRRVAAGVRLPSVRQLSEDCDVSRDTAARAYDKLVAHGLVESRPGSGYYVAAAPSRKAPEPLPSRPSLFHPNGLSPVIKLRFTLNRSDKGLASQSGSGALPEDWVDESSVAGAIRTVARGSQRMIGQYGDPQGYLPLRQQLQLKLQNQGIGTDADQIIVTTGAADALNLVVSAFMRVGGNPVLIECPCQPLLVERLMSAGVDLRAVPREADGPDLAALRALCETHRPRYFICNTALHNPTGSQLSVHKAFQILRLADEFDLTVIEDDSYGDLLPPGAATAGTRLAALDQLDRVVYIGSFSKTLAAGLRVGYLAATPERIEWLSAYRSLACIASNNITERAVYRLLSQGSYRHHCEQLRARLAQTRPRVAEALLAIGLHIDPVPSAGLYLWADLGDGIDAFPIAERLLQQGHLMAPGVLFSLDTRTHMRFNVTSSLDTGMLAALRLEIAQARA